MTKQEFIDKYELKNVSYGLGHDLTSSAVLSIIVNKIMEIGDDKLQIILEMLNDWITIIDNKT